MKWTKVALVLMVPAVALVLLGQSARPPAAEAKPTAIVTINWTLCLTLGAGFDWDDNSVVNSADATKGFGECGGGLANQTSFDNMIGAIRGISSPEDNPNFRLEKVAASHPKPEDLTAPGRTLGGNATTPLDSEAGQLHQEDGAMWIIAFVTNDDPVAFFADKGVFNIGGANAGSAVVCGPGAPNADFDFVDPDCDEDSSTEGDGVVAILLNGNDANRGPAIIRVRQDHLEMEDQYTVVGEPYKIELTASKSVLQTGASVCKLFSNTSTFLATLGAPEKSPLTAIVKDSDGTPLTGSMVVFEILSESEDVALLAQPLRANRQLALTPTLSSALGVSSPDVICGGEETGTITLRASISREIPAKIEGQGGATVDPAARERDAEVEIKVQGPPTDMTLSASPASLVCDGTATSAVSAALTDAAGNPAIDGNVVAYSVKALGTVSSFQAKSAGGVATTTLTPLSDIARGVTVNATLLFPELVEDDEGVTADDIQNCEQLLQSYPCPLLSEKLVPGDIEKALLVECSTTVPQPVPGTVPGGSSGPTVSPPSTGDGGYSSGD